MLAACELYCLSCSLLAKQIFYLCSCSQKNHSARMLANARKDHSSPLLKSSIKKIIISGLLFSILFLYSKRTSGFQNSSQYYCVTCVAMPGKLIIPRKSLWNFSISQGKCNSFKEARGRWHIPAYSPEVKHVPLAEYCIKKSNDKQIHPFGTLHSR